MPRRPRLKRTTASLETAEAEWWTKNAGLEEEFCWVQTPQLQRLLRGRYLREIAESARDGGPILELGCGTGWLSLLLAEYGAAEVHGVDFSEAQLERARNGAGAQGHAGRVQFHRIERSLAELAARRPDLRFHTLVVHGVLHHLSDQEINEALEVFTTALAAPEARVFILEPVLYRDADEPPNLLDRVVDRLILLPRVGQRSGVRRVSEPESRLMQEIDNRGDSPKETPFLPGELQAVIEPFVEVEQRRKELCFSYLAAKNLLLLGITYPRLAKVVTLPYLLLVRGVERWLLRTRPEASRLPVFELFSGRVRSSAAARASK